MIGTSCSSVRSASLSKGVQLLLFYVIKHFWVPYAMPHMRHAAWTLYLELQHQAMPLPRNAATLKIWLCSHCYKAAMSSLLVLDFHTMSPRAQYSALRIWFSEGHPIYDLASLDAIYFAHVQWLFLWKPGQSGGMDL